MAESAQKLDYAAFLARFFPNRRRHDFAAITAYVAYRDEGGLPGLSAPARAAVEDRSGRQSEEPAEHGRGEDDPDERGAG